jgi:HPr kinase/phosphorylase
VEGLGLFLRGGSGSGKSELGLELLARGHKLVADDIVEWRRDAGGRVVGSCPPLLEGFLEVRGLGILNARALYGAAAVIPQAVLELVIDLGLRAEATAEERLHGRRSSHTVLGVTVPEISLPRRVGHNLAVLVEAACRDHRLRLSGYRADEDLVERQRRWLDRPNP